MSTYIAWFSFVLAIVIMLMVGRKNLWLGFIIGALLLGIFNLEASEIIKNIAGTLSDPSILLLATAVGTIAMIGGVLEASGLMTQLFKHLSMNRKLFLIFGPGLFGMLPMPGGALLSAPLVERAGQDISAKEYAGINVWFRHTLILIYPLGALLVVSKIAKLHLYTAMLYLLPGFFLLTILGYIFLLRHIDGNLSTTESFNFKKIFMPIGIIAAAPVMHVVLISVFPGILNEIALLIAVLTSIFLAIWLGKLELKMIIPVAKKMKPWKYFLIILGMFIFLNIFKATDISNMIAKIVFCKTFLIVGIGFILGFITGRTQMPFGILLPIYFTRFQVNSVSYLTFSVMFFSIFMGYVISPIHPCISVSLEFFDVDLKDFIKALILPVILAMLVPFLISLIFL
ncbi:MAG: DUF401 family protein [Candidatus Cloacimonetes bacterium]|nr:DUF401 family protein [Candidatus Cloacimonadota bacterium]MBS3767497.1 DUF401 family protein [Candidatus Cloacimonadota bacterium]